MRIATSVLIGLSLLATPLVFGATAQQEKMKTCNADAKTKSLSGDARKDFMKTCLSASGDAAAPVKTLTPQQQKMSTCSKDAAAQKLSGDARKQYMSTCLKAK